MRPGHYTLVGKDVHEHAAHLLQRFLGLVDHGPKCTVDVLLHVMFYAASRLISLYAACLRLRDAPGSSALFKALLATLPPYAELQRRVPWWAICPRPRQAAKAEVRPRLLLQTRQRPSRLGHSCLSNPKKKAAGTTGGAFRAIHVNT